MFWLVVKFALSAQGDADVGVCEFEPDAFTGSLTDVVLFSSVRVVELFEASDSGRVEVNKPVCFPLYTGF